MKRITMNPTVDFLFLAAGGLLLHGYATYTKPKDSLTVDDTQGPNTRTKRITMKPIFYSLILVAGSLLLPGCATSGKPKASLTADDARAQLEVLRSDFNTYKIHTFNQVMKLTAAEAEKFWPVYRNYEKELAAVGDRKLALIREFFGHHRAGTLNDQNSKEMAGQWLQNVQDRLDLWKKYHRQISDAVSPMRAAQFLQVENQMAIFVDLNIASEMPMVGSAPDAKK